jgi:ABC-type sugar transport system permease subunit
MISFSFLLPALILFLVFVVVPFIQGIPISFTKWEGMGVEKTFVGMDNYLRMFSDPNVINAAKNTIIFTLFTVVFSNGLGLAFALLISKTTRYNSILRTIIFMPFCLSLVLSSYVWRYVYSDVFYDVLGIPSPLGSTTLVMFGLAIISV